MKLMQWLILVFFLTTSTTQAQRILSPIPDLYQVNSGKQFYYEDAAGRYRLTGVLMDLGGSSVGLGEDLPIERVRQNIMGKFGDLQPDQIRKTPIRGIYELLFGKMVKYIDGSGRFLFRGAKLFSQSGDNLTAKALADAAKNTAKKHLALLKQIPQDKMLIYPAKNEKHVLTVFTDTNCSFCRQLHHDIPEYNRRGVTIRYLFFPRAGVDSSSYHTAISVWCSENQQQALDNIENGFAISSQTCQHPVDKHLSLANQLNLLGTPVLMLENGELLYGYSSPDEIITKLLKLPS